MCSVRWGTIVRLMNPVCSRFAGCDTSIVDHGKNRAADWSGARHSIGELKFAVDLKECEPELVDKNGQPTATT